MPPVLQYVSLLWPNPLSTSSARASLQDPHLLWWFVFRGIKVAAQPPLLRAAMHIAVVFARAHIGRQHALAVPAGTAMTIASIGKVLLDRALVPKLAVLKTHKSRCLLQQLARAYDVHPLRCLNIVTFLCCFVRFSFVTLVTLLFFCFC